MRVEQKFPDCKMQMLVYLCHQLFAGDIDPYEVKSLHFKVKP